MIAYQARVAGDRLVAGTCEPVPGGVRLRTPELPHVRDYNGLLLAPGNPLTDLPDVGRVIAFDPAGAPPAGWDVVPLAVMAFDGPAPPAPPEVAEVGEADLREARSAVWRSFGVSGEALEEMLRMQAFQADAGRVFAVLEDGEPSGWAQVIEGFVDDVWVDPAARRRGLGRALSLAAMAAGGRYLTVEPGNAAAVGLYRSLGFADAGRAVHLTRSGG